MVVEEYKQVQENSKAITAILESPDLPEQIQNSRDYRQLVDYLVKNHNVSYFQNSHLGFTLMRVYSVWLVQFKALVT